MNNIIKNRKTRTVPAVKNIILSVLLSYGLLSCNNFLDVVPDNVFQYEDLFTSRQQAYNALANLYAHVPGENRDGLPHQLGDDYFTGSSIIDRDRTVFYPVSIMRGNQSATNTLMSFWTGHNMRPDKELIWTVMRECDQFAHHVYSIPDMPLEDKNDWAAQAKFLKAYYMFMMIYMYGPIIIPQFSGADDLGDHLFQHRAKVEDCFDYILNLIDEAIPYLKGRREKQFLGQPDQVTAKAIKARVLLYRASPFYNGNTEYYSNFLDHNREHFFSQTEDREKWKLAAEAAQQALDACKQYGFSLYEYKGIPFAYDTADYRMNRDRMKTLYDLRFRMVERWNEEIIWGGVIRTELIISNAALISKPAEYGGPAPANDGSGWLSATYRVMERFYTKNGLPLDEDRTVNTNTLHEIVELPEENSPEYAEMRGFMQPGATTINMYLNREPRFYTDLGITGGYYRSHHVRIRTTMFQGTAGGYNPALQTEWWPATGIAIQKVVHPEQYNNNHHTMMRYPYPIIRVADLYLMKAEALNEYYGPSQAVYDAVNEVRRRAGIPDVETAYANAEWVTDAALNKHLTKEGMREIILRERANEFAFEFGHRFWDMQRWKRSVDEFSKSVYGWNRTGTTAQSFFELKNLQGRKWSITDCLWPIDNRGLEKNAKLIQNPGW